MADEPGIWQRHGQNIEQLPDPFVPPVVPGGEAAPPPERPRRRWWRIGFLAFGALLLITLLWLVVTAPLGRALEPLRDPAMLLVTVEGKPIARRGAIKEAPVDAARLDPLTPAAVSYTHLTLPTTERV